MTDLSVGVDVKGVEADNIVITGITISNNSDHLYWNNIQKVQGKQPCSNNSDWKHNGFDLSNTCAYF